MINASHNEGAIYSCMLNLFRKDGKIGGIKLIVMFSL